MIDALQPLGTVSEQHASEMDGLEPRRDSIWGSTASPAPEMLLRLVLSGAPMLTCLRRLLLTIATRGALPEAAFLECVRILLDAFGGHHVLTLTALEAAGALAPAPFAHPACSAQPLWWRRAVLASVCDEFPLGRTAAWPGPQLRFDGSASDPLGACRPAHAQDAAGGPDSEQQPRGRAHPV